MYDEIMQKAGKELADVVQEGLDSENRFADTIKEGIESGNALKTAFDTMKANSLDRRKCIIQILRGAMNDVVGEDFSLDKPYEPGSQE